MKYMKEGSIINLNRYGNVVGIPKGWTSTSASVSQLKKLNIPNYKSCIGFNNYYGSRYAPILVNIVPAKCLKKIKSYFADKEEQKIKKGMELMKLISDPQKIAESIYSINKEAKKYRDKQILIAEKIYGEESKEYEISKKYGKLNHLNLHNHKMKKEYLYFLKEKALRKIIRESELTPIGYHEFDDCERDYIEIFGFGFHLNEKTTTNNLGSIK